MFHVKWQKQRFQEEHVPNLALKVTLGDISKFEVSDGLYLNYEIETNIYRFHFWMLSASGPYKRGWRQTKF